MVYIMRYIARSAELAHRLVTILRPSPCFVWRRHQDGGHGRRYQVGG
eukprot:SAG25_NODE_4375_length_828_cov_1.547325_2_plen_46_part_01